MTEFMHESIGGFRDTYLGRQVFLRPKGWDMVSWGCGGALRAPLAGFGGRASAEIEFGAFLALKYESRWQQFR